MLSAVPWLEISIDGCRIWPIAEKIGQKSLNAVLGLKIDGSMHPLPQIDGCSCTLRTRTNQGPDNYYYIIEKNGMRMDF